jgi:hypothetical protein
MSLEICRRNSAPRFLEEGKKEEMYGSNGIGSERKRG